MFPYLPGQSGWNKRLRAAGPVIARLIRALALATPTSVAHLRLIDSTPVECARSRPTARRSDLAGEAGYGYCASHSRYFWGMRLYLVATAEGMPLMWCLANPKLDEREVMTALLQVVRPRRATSVGHGRCDLAQHPHRRTPQAVPDRLRP